MTDDPHNLHFREQAETKSINAYGEEARKRYGHLTEKQVATVAAELHRVYGAYIATIDNGTFFWHLAKERPDLFRTAPTPLQVLEYRCQQLGNVSEVERLNEWRKIERASQDELLALVPADAKLSNDPAPLQKKVDAPALTDEQRAKGWNEADALHALRSGENPDEMDPVKRQEIRRIRNAEMAGPELAAVNEALAHIAAGKTWSQLSYGVQRTAFDQAKRAGKTLDQFGIDLGA